MHIGYKLTATRLLYVSLIGLTGCATSEELKSLRKEIQKTNAIAIRAEADIYRTQRELDALKATSERPVTVSKPSPPPATPTTNPSGYKWGKKTLD